MKEADLVAGMRSSNITLVDAARVPARPAKPNALLYAAAFDRRRTSLRDLRRTFPRCHRHPHPGAGRNGDCSLPKPRSACFPTTMQKQNGSAWPTPKRRLAPPSPHPSFRLLRADGLNATVAATEPRAAYTEALRVLCTSLMQGNKADPRPGIPGHQLGFRRRQEHA